MFLPRGALLSADATAQTWTVSPQPTVSIGEVEGLPGYVLNRVRR